MSFIETTYKTNLETSIDQAILELETIRLKDIGKNNQMNRFDKKFIFHASLIPELLKKASDYYYVLKVNGNCVSSYQSIYYDTPDFMMYKNHHNGKTNRFKVRIREYLDSGDRFVEIKHKDSQLYTTKERIPYEEDFPFNNEATNFIKEKSIIDPSILIQSLITNYNRITLVNKRKDERITIDFNLSVKNDNNKIEIEHLAIAEIKNNNRHLRTHFNNLLKENRINQESFSKYCIGVAMTNENVKKNEFKEKLRKIEKITS